MTKSKKQEKEIISLYKYRLYSFRGVFAMLISCVYDAVITACGVENILWARVSDKALTIVALFFLAKSVLTDIKFKPDTEDELSRYNMNRAMETLSKIFIAFILTVFVICAFINLFIDIDFMLHIDIGFIGDLFFILTSAYLSLQNGLFLLYEGKENQCEECEEE
jgi:hypothetical protein